MAHAHLNLPPDLIPWMQGGVEYLLSDTPLPPALSLCHASAPGKPAPREATAAAAPSRPGHSGRPPHPASPHPQRAPARVPEAPPAAVAAAPQSSPLLPPEHWPHLWRERLAATRPAPVLWTYWALGEDLSGAANPARRELLQRLLRDLAHPAGTHCFWPAALPVNGRELEANPDIFWSGVAQLKARALVVMGLPAVKALELPPRLRPFHQTRHNGRLVVVLRDLDLLVEENHHYDGVREFLRQALAQFARPGLV